MPSTVSVETKIHYVLRMAVAMCFIGHGAFGVVTKPIWVNYFAVFGIDKALAYKLMPILGTFDILLGIIILIKPFKIVIWWLVIWGFITAALRPLSGEPFAELVERAGNYGAPLALLFLSGFTPLLKNIKAGNGANTNTLAKVKTVLRIAAFLLLAGHGWLNLIDKKSYATLGFSSPAYMAKIVGLFELAAGVMVAVFPFKYVVVAVLIWKICSELFYPHYELFEWIERGGSYGVLLALYFLSNGPARAASLQLKKQA